MNIIIKNADFSNVAIGKAGKVEPSCKVISGALSLGLTSQKVTYFSNNNLLCYDVSQFDENSLLSIRGFIGSNKSLYCFATGTAPQSDITLTSQSEANDFTASLGTILEQGYYPDRSNGLYTETKAVPSGAKILVLNISSQTDVGVFELVQ